MQFSQEILVEVAIFILGLTGFWVARHIRKHKKEEVPLVCPIGFDCHSVVHSDYSRFMGIPVEILGMLYYAVVTIVAILFIFWSKLMPGGMTNFMGLLAVIAFIFSLYLTSVQAFILKNWCSWCLVSAGISILIFILTVL